MKYEFEMWVRLTVESQVTTTIHLEQGNDKIGLERWVQPYALSSS